MIQQNIRAIRRQIGETTLVVVSKFRSADELKQVYDLGERIFAENRVQELLKKVDLLPGDVQWHLIGHLQTNKVKTVLPLVAMIHSADSMKLLNEIEKEGLKQDLITDVLLQVHVSTDETKHGFQPEELTQLCSERAFDGYKTIRFRGLMTMSTLNAAIEVVESEFERTRVLFQSIKNFMPQPDIFTELSMGMSGDYLTAIEQGSTIVRIGSAIFLTSTPFQG